MIQFRRKIIQLACIGALTAVPGLANAQSPQSYPTKPVRVVVPLTPGGSTDSVARLMAEKLGKMLGQSFVVENRGGGDTVVGSTAVAKSAPDGYTLLINAAGIFVNHWAHTNLPYDTVKELTPVAMLTRGEWLLVAHPGVPAANLKDFIAHAKANPRKLKIAATGTATLLARLFMNVAEADLLVVPYKGAAQASTDLLSGRIDATLTALPNVDQYVRSGDLKGIAVSGNARHPKVPNVPTFAEGGLKSFEPTAWFALYATGNTPKDVVETLNAAVRTVLKDPEVVKSLADLGLAPYSATVAETESFLKAEMEEYGKLVKQVGLKID